MTGGPLAAGPPPPGGAGTEPVGGPLGVTRPDAADAVIAANLAAVRRRIADAAAAAGRDPAGVRLLLAVKTQPVTAIRAALAAGADLLGHNRAQELVATGPGLAAPGVPAHEMHFIGHLQTNKVAVVVRWASCVQSVDSARLAHRLDAAAAREPGRLDVLLQVNVSGEPTKAGCTPEEAVGVAEVVMALPRLRLRGLMTVGAHSPDAGLVRAGYDTLAGLGQELRAAGAAEATELSMGMSGDLEVAVAAGATIVRVGTAVFGPRPAAAQGTR